MKQTGWHLRRNAFIDAVKNGDAKSVKMLLAENGELVNALGSDGMSPLHFAATPQIAEILLKHGADINLRDCDHNGTPAQWTIRKRPKVCQYLLEQGAKADIVLYCMLGDVERARVEFENNPELLTLRINVKSPQGYTVPSQSDGEDMAEVPGGHVYANQIGPTMPLLEIALQSKQSGIVDLLIDLGYEINLRDWYSLVGQGQKRFDALLKGFIAKGRDINALQKHRKGMWSPLHWVAQRGLTVGIETLLENGADPNVTDDKGQTPLHFIAQKGIGKNQVQLLLEHGADLNRRDDAGQTPLDYAKKAKRKSLVDFLTNLGATIGSD